MSPPAAISASDLLSQQCIGRTLGALKTSASDWKGRGCDWAAFGLLRGPWEVVMEDRKSVWTFPLADAPGSEGGDA
nr:VVA0879 family protein [Spongiactinospora gelatinilytica]